MLLFELKGLFERVRIRLVDFETEVALVDPSAVLTDAEQRVADGNLLDRNDDFHGECANPAKLLSLGERVKEISGSLRNPHAHPSTLNPLAHARGSMA